MPWPLSSAVNWRNRWEGGESLLLVCPWLADDVLARVQTLLYPVLHQEETAWFVAPNERWFQLLSARVARYKLDAAYLGPQASARDAAHVRQQWETYELDLILMDNQWLPAMLEAQPHLPLRLIGIGPTELLGLHHSVSHTLAEPLADIPSAWLTPPVTRGMAQQLKTAFSLTESATVPINPAGVSITRHFPTKTLRSLYQFMDEASYTRPVLWVSDDRRPPEGLPVETTTWEHLPFALQPGMCVIVPTPPEHISDWLMLCGCNLSLDVHIWLSPEKHKNRLPLLWQQLYDKTSCAWQQTMSYWQGTFRHKQPHPPVPRCGHCTGCITYTNSRLRR